MIIFLWKFLWSRQIYRLHCSSNHHQFNDAQRFAELKDNSNNNDTIANHIETHLLECTFFFLIILWECSERIQASAWPLLPFCFLFGWIFSIMHNTPFEVHILFWVHYWNNCIKRAFVICFLFFGTIIFRWISHIALNQVQVWLFLLNFYSTIQCYNFFFVCLFFPFRLNVYKWALNCIK